MTCPTNAKPLEQVLSSFCSDRSRSLSPPTSNKQDIASYDKPSADSGLPQTLIVKADEDVLVNSDNEQGLVTNKLNVQPPTLEEFIRIKAFCLANPGEIITVDSAATSITIRGIAHVKDDQ